MKSCSGSWRLRIAGVRLAVSSEQAIRLRIGNPLYRPFVAGAVAGRENPMIGIRLVLGPLPSLQGLEKIYDTRESWFMCRDKKHFWIAMAPPRHSEPFWIARFDRRVTRVIVYLPSVSPAPGKRMAELELPVVYPLDQLLLMYFLARRQGVLTHAAGVVRGGKAMIFAGASGAGKSTFSELLTAAKIGKLLSDERVIVREIDGVMQAFGTPWSGTAGIARNANAPLAGIYFLKHGQNNHIEKLASGAALDKLLPMLSIPWYDPDTMSRIIAFAKHLLGKVPAFEMSFKPDRSAVDFFWQFIKKTS
jgi:hypothetical protein